MPAHVAAQADVTLLLFGSTVAQQTVFAAQFAALVHASAVVPFPMFPPSTTGHVVPLLHAYEKTPRPLSVTQQTDPGTMHDVLPHETVVSVPPGPASPGLPPSLPGAFASPFAAPSPAAEPSPFPPPLPTVPPSPPAAASAPSITVEVDPPHAATIPPNAKTKLARHTLFMTPQ